VSFSIGFYPFVLLFPIHSSLILVHHWFFPTIDNADVDASTNTTTPVATAANGPTVHKHLPMSSTGRTFLLLLLLLYVNHSSFSTDDHDDC